MVPVPCFNQWGHGWAWVTVIEVARFFSVFDVWLLPWLAVASVECRRGHRSNQEIILLIFDDDAVVWLHRWDEQEVVGWEATLWK